MQVFMFQKNMKIIQETIFNVHTQTTEIIQYIIDNTTEDTVELLKEENGIKHSLKI